MSISVLIVDDSVVMRTVVQKTLRMSGLPLGAVHEAGDGAAALALLRREKVDLVMLDISMPGMRGDEMLEQLRADPALADVAVVVVSSERSAARLARMQQLGAVFVPKPFAPEQVRAVVLNLPELRHELATQ